MSLIVINNNNERIVFPEGSHNAVLAGAFSLGLQPGYKNEKPKRKHAYVFEIDKKIPHGPLEGQPYMVHSIMSDTYHEKSRLFAAVRALKGGLDAQELKTGFNPESMVGLGCTVVTANVARDGKTFANIVSILGRNPALPPLTPTLDMSKVPEWIKRMQDQRLDKPTATSNAA